MSILLLTITTTISVGFNLLFLWDHKICRRELKYKDNYIQDLKKELAIVKSKLTY